jgi:hypothetical protein
MNAPTTLREEIRQTLAASKEPMTRDEIFQKCKFAPDEKALAQAILQLCVIGDIKKAGERERIGARALPLYTRRVHADADAVASGGGRVKAKKRPGPKPGKKKARKPYKKRAAPERSARLPKVQRRNADSPAPDAPGFRCGLYSDGSIDLERGVQTFSLSEPEVRVLLRLVERLSPAEERT